MFFSTVIGFAGTFLFLYALRGYIGLGNKPKPKNKRVLPWLTGFVERSFFTTIIGLGINGVAPAIIAWLALKMLTNWNSKVWEEDPKAKAFAFTALLAGLVSMFFAVLGGLIWEGKL